VRLRAATLAAKRCGVLRIEPTPDLAVAAKFLNMHLHRRDRCIVRAVGQIRRTAAAGPMLLGGQN